MWGILWVYGSPSNIPWIDLFPFRLLFLYLKAKSHRDGHSYCSSQGCERVKIQAATDSKDISNCMAKAYPQYYRKPSALKRMPSVLTRLCQGCGTRQVIEEEGTVGRRKNQKHFLILFVSLFVLAMGTFFFETSVLPSYKYCMISPKFWPLLESDSHKKQTSPNSW